MSVRDQFSGAQINEKSSYNTVLSNVQTKVKNNYSDLIANNSTADIKEQLITAIEKIIIDEKISVEGYTIKELSSRIYDDMAGSSFLNKYIYQSNKYYNWI